MYRIAYIDDDTRDIHKFERDMENIFEVEAVQIQRDTVLQDLVKKLIDGSFDYLIVDFHLSERTGCGYNGDEVLKLFLDELPHFPAMLLTNFDENAIESAKNLDVDKIHRKFSNDEQLSLFVARVKAKIEQYRENRKVKESRLIELKEKSAADDLTANEEEEAIEIDTFLEQTLGKSPDLAKTVLSSNSSRLDTLLTKTDSLIEKLEQYENISR